MDWSRRVKPAKIRRLYRSARLGIYDDDSLQDVGLELYARCADIAAVADAYRSGRVPCPKCGTKVQRKINAMFGLGGQHGSRNNWFHCPHCSKRLIWTDCRRALRDNPRCFDCHTLLKDADELSCRCGKAWDRKSYRRSVSTRVRLPCPSCETTIRKPTFSATQRSAGTRIFDRELECPKCQGSAQHVPGYIQCNTCGYNRRWRDYRKGLKKRDEMLDCTACGNRFRWQAWRKGASSLRTGNPLPARDFVKQWPKCRTPQTRMMQIDFLLQTLHGRGPLAPLFIEGDEQSICHLLDEIATQV